MKNWTIALSSGIKVTWLVPNAINRIQFDLKMIFWLRKCWIQNLSFTKQILLWSISFVLRGFEAKEALWKFIKHRTVYTNEFALPYHFSGTELRCLIKCRESSSSQIGRRHQTKDYDTLIDTRSVVWGGYTHKQATEDWLNRMAYFQLNLLLKSEHKTPWNARYFSFEEIYLISDRFEPLLL